MSYVTYATVLSSFFDSLSTQYNIAKFVYKFECKKELFYVRKQNTRVQIGGRKN